MTPARGERRRYQSRFVVLAPGLYWVVIGIELKGRWIKSRYAPFDDRVTRYKSVGCLEYRTGRLDALVHAVVSELLQALTLCPPGSDRAAQRCDPRAVDQEDGTVVLAEHAEVLTPGRACASPVIGAAVHVSDVSLALLRRSPGRPSGARVTAVPGDLGSVQRVRQAAAPVVQALATQIQHVAALQGGACQYFALGVRAVLKAQDVMKQPSVGQLDSQHVCFFLYCATGCRCRPANGPVIIEGLETRLSGERYRPWEYDVELISKRVCV